MPSVSFGPSDQSLNLKNMFYHVVAFLYRLPCLALELRLLDSAMSIFICQGKIQLRCSTREYRAIKNLMK